ncbi:peptidoglycan-binding domain-containing protein [Actinocorallia longicatena]|uniref:Peptidoglycan-binding protein n=1 Tax=Actinocorallia longicatena TaxID=111803 RepID=A0ABP6QC69_9ACTN
MRRRRALAAGAVVVAASGGGLFAVLQDGSTQPAAAKSVKTADIERGDLVDTENVDGTLTYGDERNLTAGPAGVVTWTPAEGAIVKRGKSLAKIDGSPVTLMYGRIPMYRQLGSGTEGKDVKQLEANLKALGYGDDLTVDEDYTSATASAVREWQEDRGLDETGTVTADQIVFQPGAVRVKEVKTAVGARGPAGFSVTGTTRTVHVDLVATAQNLARLGAKATVNLPSGDSFDGRITTVGTVAKKVSQDSEETVDLEISLGKAKTGRIDQAPVTVDLESERRKNVLSVPVEALIALSEGGFGVEVSENGATRLTGVELGVFGDGRVEVEGEGLKEGMKVTVPHG